MYMYVYVCISLSVRDLVDDGASVAVRGRDEVRGRRRPLSPLTLDHNPQTLAPDPSTTPPNIVQGYLAHKKSPPPLGPP